MSSDLPAKFDDSAFGYDDAPAIETAADMRLSVDQDNGVWSYGGTSMDSKVVVSFVARHAYRVLFGKDYDSLGDNEPNTIVCRSADGFTGKGLGRMFRRGDQAWRSEIKERTCVDRETGQRVCPSASGKGRDWHCRPQTRVLMMVQWEGGNYVPAFFEARGRSHQPTEKAFSNALRKMKAAGRIGDTREWKTPMWRLAFQGEIVQPAGRKRGYMVSWRGPKEYADAEFAPVDAWVRNTASGLWTTCLEEQKGLLDLVGEIREDEPRGEAFAEPIPPAGTADFDGIPF